MKKELLIFFMVISALSITAQHTISHDVNIPPTKQQSPKTPTKKEKVPEQEEMPIEKAGYDVTITCNVPSAILSIDEMKYGHTGESHFLKTGSHTVKIIAERYETLDSTITVSSLSTSFFFVLKEKALPDVIQKLVNNMVYVEGGTYMMGKSTDNKQVTVSSFSIGRYEVTQEEWQAVMGSNPSRYKGSKFPVENVSWDDCQEFIAKLNTLTGKHFRMATETEWEFAARGGNRNRGYKYVGSDILDDVVWYQDNSDLKTHDVGLKKPNELGLYDMCGNVWEWCSGNYNHKDIYGSNGETNTTGSSTGSYRVYRGCGFMTILHHCNVWERLGAKPNERSFERGLRLAL